MMLVCETISPAQQIGQFAESAFKQYAQEIIDLRTQLAAAQAHIEALRGAMKLVSARDNMPGMIDEALAIQTSDEALRRHDAELLRKFASKYSYHREYFGETINDDAEQLAAELEKSCQS